MIYLDSNVFIHAALNRKELGEKSRQIIRDVQSEKISGATSTLVFDELVWAVRRQRNHSQALLAGEAFLNMPSLIISKVDRDTLASALALLKKYGFGPRDSIHAASAIELGSDYIVSEDPDFDALNEIKRKPIMKV